MFTSVKCIPIRQLLTRKCSRNMCLSNILQPYHKSNSIILENKRLLYYNLNFNRNYRIFNNYYYNRICTVIYFTKSNFSSTTRTQVNEQLEKSEVEEVKKKFPRPKLTFNNIYGTVANEIKSNESLFNVQYKQISLGKGFFNWSCTVNIKWPENLKFQKTSITKSEALDKVIWNILTYLLKIKKITEAGSPVVYDNDDIKEFIQENKCPLSLSNIERENLMELNYIFDTKIKPLLVENPVNSDYASEDLSEFSGDISSIFFPTVNRKNLSHYWTHEVDPLPIQEYKDEFKKLLSTNQVIIIRGETGCGKSTRIPQYALEHFVQSSLSGSARIVVTEPRKIAAISLAERVAFERNEPVGKTIGYQVRLQSKLNPRTCKILFCTTGMLLRYTSALKDFTHIILDEAHERDVNTDLLMNLVRDALDVNPNLRVIVMSATIDVDLFRKYFNNAPVMNIPGFTYPVKEHYLDDLNLNLEETVAAWKKPQIRVIHDDVFKVIKHLHETKPEGAILVFLPGWEDIINVKQLLLNSRLNNYSIVSIHSKLSPDEQRKIFARLPPGNRKIVLATNIAETSVTIDDVVYVIDTGIHKEIRFDTEKGISCLDNYPISKSSKAQRKGRAGRVQPGESYHLYTRSAYNHFEEFSVPEILRVPLSKIVLDAKTYNQSVPLEDFFSQLVTPPDPLAVYQATRELKELDMLDANENLTYLGRLVSHFQLPPKLSKAMVNSLIYKCVLPIVDIVTIFSSHDEMFAHTLTSKDHIRVIKQAVNSNSDHIAMMILFELWNDMIMNDDFEKANIHCKQNGLSPGRLNSLRLLKQLHYEYLDKFFKQPIEFYDEFSTTAELVKGVLLSGVGSVLLQRNWDFIKRQFKKRKVYLTCDNRRATITSDSVNYKEKELPILLYINETHSEIRRSTIVRETSLIKPLTFILFKNAKLEFSEVSKNNNNVNENELISIRMSGIKYSLMCSRKDAQIIIKCKSALKQMENYFLYQLFTGAEDNVDILNNWNEMLYSLQAALKFKNTA